jgi:hypothetical protein
MRWVLIVVGALAVAAGTIFTLQGLNILGGSSMTGDTTWAIAGPIIAAVGLLLLLVGARRRDRTPD